MNIKRSLNAWSDFDKRWLDYVIIFDKRWLDYAIIFVKQWLDYLIIFGKVDLLNGQDSLWKLHSKFFRFVYRDFVLFHQSKNPSFNCPVNNIYWTLSMVGLVIVPPKLYWLIKVGN